MTPIEDLWKQYQRYTTDATELCRKLGFAAGAICWLLKNDDASFSAAILWALLMLVGFFLADAAQSIVSAALYRRWLYGCEARSHQEGRQDVGYDKPRSLDVPAFRFFWLKFMFLLFSFACITFELLRRQAAL